MRLIQSQILKDSVLALIIAGIGYVILLLSYNTGIVDMSIEAVLFFSGSMIGLKGYFKSKETVNKYFRRFELFYGLTYLTVVISFLMGIYYYLQHPNIAEIGVKDITKDNWLIVMSTIKSFSMIFLILTWSFFYKHLKIKQPTRKKILLYAIGTLFYLGASIVIWQLTNDTSVLSLGVVVGSVVGIFAMIALDKRTRFLTIIFILYSAIHLIDFYMMGKGKNLTTGIVNPIYWGVTVLYVLEVRRWIKKGSY